MYFVLTVAIMAAVIGNAAFLNRKMKMNMSK